MISYIMHQESPGIAWNGPELSGIARNRLESPEFIRIRPESLGIAWGQVSNDLLHQAGMAHNHSNGPELSGMYCQESPGIGQNHQELPRITRNVRNHQEMPGITRNVRNHPESPEFPEIPRNWPESPGIAWNLPELPGIGRNRPELHRFACNCFAQICSALLSCQQQAMISTRS